MFSKWNVLYVEDDKDTLELVSVMLNHSGVNCNVVSANTADEALALIEKQIFDLYILDYSIPEMSGVELCRRIRRFDSNTPIIFFTANAFEYNRKAAMGAKANDYLVKPNDLERLPETVHNYLINSSNSEPRIQSYLRLVN